MSRIHAWLHRKFGLRSLRLRRPLLAGFLLCVGAVRLAGDSNYEVAVAAKMTEIKWKQADLQAAQREVAILSQFLGSYDAKMGNLTSVRQQLAAANTQLASIQQGNLVKLTIRMGIETYNTVSDTINLGKTAATALISRGVTSAVGDVALDQLTGGLSNQAQAALGLDAETLGSPRTVKVRAVSDAARAAYPELARVQQSLALSLEAVKIAARMQDGTELGDTGALLRKNIMVREEIAAALGKLDALGTEAASARTESEPKLTAAQADVDRLTNELSALNSELGVLQEQWRASEATARLAANQAALVPPVQLPVPSVSVTRGENEDDWQYQARVAAAIIAAAQARWNDEAPPLIAAITARQGQISTLQSTIDTACTTHVENPSLVYFIHGYGGSDKVDASVTASYESAMSVYAGLDAWVTAVTSAGAALPDLITQVEALTDHYTALFNSQFQLTSLYQLLQACHAPLPGTYSPAMGVPGMGQEAAEDLAVVLGQHVSRLPKALANARSQLDQLAAAIAAWSSGIGSVRDDLDGNLDTAQQALNELIARGTAWNSALAAATGMTVDFARGDSDSRLGYFVGSSFVRVVQNAFSLGTYKTSLCAALSTPGAAGLAAARELRTRYDTLTTVAPAMKDAYDSAWQRFRSAYARVHAYAQSGGFPVYDDWVRAAAYSSSTHPVNASSVSDQALRYNSLFNTQNSQHVTSLAGGEPIPGQTVLFWSGLPRLRQLPDPGMDDPAAFIPHRLIAAKATIVENGPTWIPLAPDVFNARYTEVWNELWSLHSLAEQASDGTKGTVEDVLRELGTFQTAYVAAHPIAAITKQPASSLTQIPEGTTHTAQLSVTASGDFLTYQWYVSRWMTADYGWDAIPGATSATLTTPALTETRLFRVTITNPGGTVTSDDARVEVYLIYPPPVFTSAAFASAQVGVPFSWKFTTEPAGWVSAGHMAPLPPGLTFQYMEGGLEGTPTEAGTWDLEIMASNRGSFSYQTFRLTIAPGTLAPFDAWVQACTTAQQRLNPAFTQPAGMPAGDGVSNLLKYAFNLIGTGPGQVPSLDAPCATTVQPNGNSGLPAGGGDGSGRLTLRYVRRKAASAAGITYTIEFSTTLAADSWSANTTASESVTSIDDTWERVLVTDAAAFTGTRFLRVRVVKP